MDNALNPTLDNILLSPAQAGIAAAEFDELMLQHQRRIYRLLVSLVRDPDEASNLTQECFIRAFEARDRYRGEASVGTWLTRIAVNLATDHARSRRQSFWRRLFRSDQSEHAEFAARRVAAPVSDPEQQLLAREAMQSVWRTLDRLSPRQRTVFVLRFVEDMSLEQIAQVTGMETGTVKSHLSRSLKAVRSNVRGMR